MRSIQKIIICLLVMVAGYRQVAAQTTTINNNGRYYCVNRPIGGNSSTEDGEGPNYILLHQAYNGTLLDDHLVMGKITGIRGTTSSWNRKWTVEINTASAYDGDRGSILTYNEAQDVALVTLTYGGAKYLAVQIMNGSSLSGFSFTGYVYNESLTLVTDDVVSNVQEFTATDPLSVQGDLYVGNNLGIGTISPIAPLSVVGSNASTLTLTRQNTSAATVNAAGAIDFRVDQGTSGGATGQSLVARMESAVEPGWGGHLAFYTKPIDGNPASALTERMRIAADGSVAIGTTDTKGYKLAVAGNVIATEVNVKLQAQWPDYVFDSAYTPQPLAQVEQFIKDNKHLPNVPSAEEVKKAGINLGDNQAVLLKKVEELTLYAIQQETKINQQDATIQSLEEKMKHLEELVKAVTTKNP